MYDICCIGHITADKITTPAGTHYLPGGTAWYFCKALAKMDVRYQLLTALGNPEIKYYPASIPFFLRIFMGQI
jgi:sugar/nucleoside kinase (ribokinase family)